MLDASSLMLVVFLKIVSSIKELVSRNKKPRQKTGLKVVKVISSFGDIGGLQAFGAALDLELHTLAFRKSAKAVAFDGFEVHKHIITSFTLDEAVTFSFIEPFDCAGFHYLDRLSLCKVKQARRAEARTKELERTTSFCNDCSHTDKSRSSREHVRGTLVEHNNLRSLTLDNDVQQKATTQHNPVSTLPQKEKAIHAKQTRCTRTGAT